MEGDGNAGLTLFERKVLLEIYDQKQFFHLSRLNSFSISQGFSILYDYKWWELGLDYAYRAFISANTSIKIVWEVCNT